MYNLIVSAEYDAWEKGNYKISLSRFLEYTSDEIKNRFRNILINEPNKLKDLPTIFAYEEAIQKKPLFGKIEGIIVENNNITIYYEPKKLIELETNFLNKYANMLNINNYELMRTHWAIKNVDLIEIINNSNDYLNSKFNYKKNDNDFNTLRNLKYKPLLSNQIKSFMGFFEKINQNHSNEEYEYFYRGHANYKYELVPSLFRTNSNGNYLHMNKEDLLFKDIIVENPSDFSSDKTAVEKLVRMQHYSLPTRLLDITSNPLVALYFACLDDNFKTGEVIVFKVKKEFIKYYDSDTVSCISNLSQLTFLEKEQLSNLISNVDDSNIRKFNSSALIKRLLHFIKEEKPYFEPKIKPKDLKKIICIKSKKSNSRVVSQSGNFLLFGLDAVLSDSKQSNIEIEKIQVSDKGRLLNELDMLDINESTIFPGIEHSAKYIANRHKIKEK